MNEIKQIETKQRNSAHKLGAQGNCKKYQKAKVKYLERDYAVNYGEEGK